MNAAEKQNLKSYVYDPPTGLPWPLDGAQHFFETMFSSVLTWINSAASWIIEHVWDPIRGYIDQAWDAITAIALEGRAITGELVKPLPWPWNRIVEFFLTPFALTYSLLKPAITWVADTLRPGIDWLRGAVEGIGQTVLTVAGQVWQLMPEWVKGPIAWLRELAVKAWDALWAFVQDPVGSIQTGLNHVINTVGGAISGAVNTLGGWVSEALAGVTGALGNALQGFLDWVGEKFGWLAAKIMGFVTWVVDAVKGVIEMLVRGWIGTLTKAFQRGSPQPELLEEMQTMIKTTYDRVTAEIKAMYASPPSPERVIETAVAVAGLLGVGIVGIKVLAAAADAAHPSKDIGFKDIATTMIASTAAATAMAGIMRAPIDVGLLKPLSYAWNQTFTPSIPPPADLVTMVVREAFVPEMVTPAPDVFAEYMRYHGFSKVWADRYWTMHWVPIALRQAYENLWRGYWDKDRFMYALHIADIHPMWREDIYNVAFRPPAIRELGYGFDVGMYTVDDIVMYRRWAGLSPEDAEKAGVAMVMYRTEAEREALRREALADFVEGLDDLTELEEKLRDTGTRDELVELWTARALYRRERDFKIECRKVLKRAAIDGKITPLEFETEMRVLGFKEWRITLDRREIEFKRRIAEMKPPGGELAEE